MKTLGTVSSIGEGTWLGLTWNTPFFKQEEIKAWKGLRVQSFRVGKSPGLTAGYVARGSKSYPQCALLTDITASIHVSSARG